MLRKAFGDAVIAFIDFLWKHYFKLHFAVVIVGVLTRAFLSYYAALGLALLSSITVLVILSLPDVPYPFWGPYILFAECVLLGLAAYALTQSLAYALATPALFVAIAFAAALVYPEEELEKRMKKSPCSIERRLEKWAKAYSK